MKPTECSWLQSWRDVPFFFYFEVDLSFSHLSLLPKEICAEYDTVLLLLGQEIINVHVPEVMLVP